MKRKTRKPQNRRASRKTARKPKPDIEFIDLDQFYKLANHVQISRESVEFVAKVEDEFMFDNLLKDLELPFTSHIDKRCIKYTVTAGKERLIEDGNEEILEEFPDEIAEDGQIFF